MIPGFIQQLARDLGVEAMQELITHVYRAVHGISISCGFQEAGYKIVAKWYRSPRVLHKIFPESSDQCWRWGQEEVTILHIFWAYPEIREFWRPVGEVTQCVTTMQLDLTPSLFLLLYSVILW